MASGLLQSSEGLAGQAMNSNTTATATPADELPLAALVEPTFRKVLIVDDDPAMRRVLVKVLKSAGFAVREAADGSEAIEIIRQNAPYYVITDWDMPVLDGAEFCRMVRQEELPHYVYIVMLTGTYADNLVEGLACGADDFLTKPVKPQELLARVKTGTRVLELEHRLNILARSDPLTGLLNRRTFFELMEKEWARSCRSDRPLCCVMIDIDFFKRINDTAGHPAGDAVLTTLARRLEGCCRTNDYVCRYGGEEFCVLLGETNRQGASLWAERCRAAIAETPCKVGEADLQVTASLGVAQRRDDDDSPEQLLDRADQALLAAKREGRNRVTTTPAPDADGDLVFRQS